SAVAALAATMALASAGSAMAGNTALCSASEEPCASANLVTHVHFEGTRKLLTSGFVVLCKILYLGDVLALGAPQITHGNSTETDCMIEGSSTTCTVTEVSTTHLLKFLRTAINLAEVTGDGEFKVSCAGFISCTYASEGLVGHGLGSELPSTAGKITVSE